MAVAVASAGPYANLHPTAIYNNVSTPPLHFLHARCPSCIQLTARFKALINRKLRMSSRPLMPSELLIFQYCKSIVVSTVPLYRLQYF